MISNQTPSQMMGFVIKTRNKTIVIDGGCLGDEEQLVNLLKEISKGYVDAWFFTHPHQDHIGCFYNVRHKYKEIKVGKVYHHFPDLDTLLSYGS